jgi:hypothetical protein
MSGAVSEAPPLPTAAAASPDGGARAAAAASAPPLLQAPPNLPPPPSRRPGIAHRVGICIFQERAAQCDDRLQAPGREVGHDRVKLLRLQGAERGGQAAIKWCCAPRALRAAPLAGRACRRMRTPHPRRWTIAHLKPWHAEYERGEPCRAEAEDPQAHCDRGPRLSPQPRPRGRVIVVNRGHCNHAARVQHPPGAPRPDRAGWTRC